MKLVLGSKANLKITTPEDLALAEAYLAQQEAAGAGFPGAGAGFLRRGA